MPIPAATAHTPASIIAGPWNEPDIDASTPMVRMPAPLYSRLLRQAQELNAAGLKAYGLLVVYPRHADFPYQAVDVVLMAPYCNRRNEPASRAALPCSG